MLEIKRGDIVNVDLGEKSVGSEQRGCRPAVVIQNDTGNLYSSTTIVAFVTASNKKHYPTHVTLKSRKGLRKKSTVLTEQIRSIDKARIISKCGALTDDEMIAVTNALRVSLDIV